MQKEITGRIPLNLQFFAEGGGDGAAGGENGGDSKGSSTPAPSGTNLAPKSAEIDYDKLISVIQGKQNVAEEQVLKSYFKEQGLSADEMKQAITAFKDQRAKNQPDVAALQTQLMEQTKLAQQEQLKNAATLEALALGYDQKTIPYVLKLADLSAVIDKDGKINKEAITAAINKVAEELPQLKPSQDENKGFQIGGAATGQQGSGSGGTKTQEKSSVAQKRWNRWN